MQQEISLHFFFFRSTAPLHYATREGKQDVVKYLLFECGSNPYAKNEDGENAIDLASSINETRILQIFSEFQARK